MSDMERLQAELLARVRPVCDRLGHAAVLERLARHPDTDMIGTINLGLILEGRPYGQDVGPLLAVLVALGHEVSLAVAPAAGGVGGFAVAPDA